MSEPLTFGENVTAFVFKDANDNKFVAFGVGYIKEAEPKDIEEIVKSVKERNPESQIVRIIDDVEQSFDLTLTDETKDFSREDEFVVHQIKPSNSLEGMLFGVNNEIMKIA